MIDLNKELAWVTFLDHGFEQKWYPVRTYTNAQQEFDAEATYKLCQKKYSDRKWGIAPTSQMILRNAVRDNF